MTMPKFEPVAYQHMDGMLSSRLPGGGVRSIIWTPLYTAEQLQQAYEAGKQASQVEQEPIAQLRNAEGEILLDMRNVHRLLDTSNQERDALSEQVKALEAFMQEIVTVDPIGRGGKDLWIHTVKCKAGALATGDGK